MPSSTVDDDLIPEPLSTHATQIKLTGRDKNSTQRRTSASQARRLSQYIIRHHSLGVKTPSHRVSKRRHSLYKCSVCHVSLGPKAEPYTLLGTSSGRIFCKQCWEWIHHMAICWTCGEIVGRREERIGFGWCWWHYPCLACLICKVRRSCWAGKTY